VKRKYILKGKIYYKMRTIIILGPALEDFTSRIAASVLQLHYETSSTDW
jgi:hypothetical protein